MSSFLNIFKHVLPKGRAFNLTPEKNLRNLFKGLDFSNERQYFDETWLDIFPSTTRDIDSWELHFFGVIETKLSDAERRARLLAAWQQEGGQDPEYIQNTLQANGFDVYVHDWWDPVDVPVVGLDVCVTPRNPFLYLKEENGPTAFTILCGEAIAECGEPGAECGERSDPAGYPLVNKIYENTLAETILCGEAIAECGEPGAECGELSFNSFFKKYTLPADPEKWPYFIYIGGASFPDTATVDAGRREEFEALCLKLCPLHMWLGMLIEY